MNYGRICSLCFVWGFFPQRDMFREYLFPLGQQGQGKRVRVGNTQEGTGDSVNTKTDLWAQLVIGSFFLPLSILFLSFLFYILLLSMNLMRKIHHIKPVMYPKQQIRCLWLIF